MEFIVSLLAILQLAVIVYVVTLFTRMTHSLRSIANSLAKIEKRVDRSASPSGLEE